MAAEFIGYSILVTLHNPPGFQLDGVVSNVINQKLYLREGRHFRSFLLSIADARSDYSQYWPEAGVVFTRCNDNRRP